MWLFLSHLVAFITLSAAAVYDLKTTEVPDSLSIITILAGIALHGVAAYTSGSLDPLLWSLGVGAVMAVYGWGMYYYGMWGGADAFVITALGFAAPYGLNGASILYPANLFVNIMVVGFVYTLGFSLYKASQQRSVFRQTYRYISDRSLYFSSAVVLSALISFTLQHFTGAEGVLYFLAFSGMTLLYGFLKVIEDDVMTAEISIDDLEEGEVVAAGQGVGRTIKGITREEIESLDTDKVLVKTGVRFVPVFPIALLLTDLSVGGLFMLALLFN